jgi:hypothetical protein
MFSDNFSCYESSSSFLLNADDSKRVSIKYLACMTSKTSRSTLLIIRFLLQSFSSEARIVDWLARFDVLLAGGIDRPFTPSTKLSRDHASPWSPLTASLNTCAPAVVIRVFWPRRRRSTVESSVKYTEHPFWQPKAFSQLPSFLRTLICSVLIHNITWLENKKCFWLIIDRWAHLT